VRGEVQFGAATVREGAYDPFGLAIAIHRDISVKRGFQNG
jgi:hypothetical protein